jgi:hypothetical protein
MSEMMAMEMYWHFVTIFKNLLDGRDYLSLNFDEYRTDEFIEQALWSKWNI